MFRPQVKAACGQEGTREGRAFPFRRRVAPVDPPLVTSSLAYSARREDSQGQAAILKKQVAYFIFEASAA